MGAYPPSSNLVGLHVHSDHSFLDGLQSIPDMVSRACLL